MAFCTFFLGAVSCLFFSTLSHSLKCYSPFLRDLFSKLDYCGITSLIMGSFVAWVYFAFYCDLRARLAYLVLVCFLGLSSVIVSWSRSFSKTHWRPLRAGVFTLFAMAGLAPAIHFGVKEGLDNDSAMRSLAWLFTMGFLYLMGAIVYTFRIPERYYPGKFDIWMSSHQIFHVFVLGGAVVHYVAIFEMAVRRVQVGVCDFDAEGDTGRSGLATYFLQSPPIQVEFQEKLVFGAFFTGAILCLGFSTLFHTVSCHSHSISKIFSKLDYCGISLLIMGSFVPWLYYGFYCHLKPKLVYLTGVCALGIASITFSLWDKFSESDWRHVRAGVFISFGLFGVVPIVHFGLTDGWFNIIFQKSLGWMLLMGVLYIMGAVLYALRVPERFFPGKFDIWLHSHQIFHIFVLGGAFVHYHGITEIAKHRVEIGQCEVL